MSQPSLSPAPILEIRRARPTEMEACADLYLKVLRETFTWMAPDRHSRDDFFRFAREEEIYVALEDGALVGLAGFYRPQSFIHSLYVDVRGRGVGRALIAHLAATAAHPLCLKVQLPNLGARAFYAREGFVGVEQGCDPGSDITWLRMVRNA